MPRRPNAGLWVEGIAMTLLILMNFGLPHEGGDDHNEDEVRDLGGKEGQSG